jgi:hypothetical protein
MKFSLSVKHATGWQLPAEANNLFHQHRTLPTGFLQKSFDGCRFAGFQFDYLMKNAEIAAQGNAIEDTRKQHGNKYFRQPAGQGSEELDPVL